MDFSLLKMKGRWIQKMLCVNYLFQGLCIWVNWLNYLIRASSLNWNRSSEDYKRYWRIIDKSLKVNSHYLWRLVYNVLFMNLALSSLVIGSETREVSEISAKTTTQETLRKLFTWETYNYIERMKYSYEVIGLTS